MDSAHSLRRQRELFILPLSSDFEEIRKSMSEELRSGRLCVSTKKWWLLPGSNQRPVDYDSVVHYLKNAEKWRFSVIFP